MSEMKTVNLNGVVMFVSIIWRAKMMDGDERIELCEWSEMEMEGAFEL